MSRTRSSIVLSIVLALPLLSGAFGDLGAQQQSGINRAKTDASNLRLSTANPTNADIDKRLQPIEAQLDSIAAKLAAIEGALNDLRSKMSPPDLKADWTQDPAFKDLWTAIGALRQALCDTNNNQKWCR